MKTNPNLPRAPAVAGQFYDGHPETLRRRVDQLLSIGGGGAESADNQPLALIVPHAGYVYSGATAAKTFATAAGREFRRILLLGPSHRTAVSGLALANSPAFLTPLGEVPVDLPTVERLAAVGVPEMAIDNQAHAAEHCLEVQLPFIQRLFPGTPIVPILCGHPAKTSIGELSGIMREFWGGGNLWVVSGDFTHYGAAFGYTPMGGEPPNAKLRSLDLDAVEKILAFDSEGFTRYLEETGATICGGTPIKLLLAVIDGLPEGERGRLTAELVEYRNSAEISGDTSHCVGYAGIAVRHQSATKADR